MILMQKERDAVYVNCWIVSMLSPFMVQLLHIPRALIVLRPHHIISKRIDAAADLAAKEAEYKILQEENKQREKINKQKEKYKCTGARARALTGRKGLEVSQS